MGPNKGKEVINKRKSQPMDQEKIFANDETNKGLISKIYNSTYNSISNKQNKQQSKTGQET